MARLGSFICESRRRKTARTTASRAGSAVATPTCRCPSLRSCWPAAWFFTTVLWPDSTIMALSAGFRCCGRAQSCRFRSKRASRFSASFCVLVNNRVWSCPTSFNSRRLRRRRNRVWSSSPDRAIHFAIPGCGANFPSITQARKSLSARAAATSIKKSNAG